MIRRAALGLLVLVAARSAAAQASSEVRIEGGYARMRQAGDSGAGADAALLSAFWRKPYDTWAFLTSANLTYGRDDIAAAQGVAAISVPWSVDERLRSEAGLAGAQFSLRNAGRGGNVNVFARQHFVIAAGGAWLGGGIARTSREGTRSHSAAADVGAWGRLSFLYGSASYARQQSSDFPLLVADASEVDPTADRYVVEDLELVLEARGGPNSLAVSWATRRGLSGTTATFAALSTSGILQLNERVAFTASYGRQLADPVRGLPEADLATASLRVSLGRKPLPVMQRSAIARATVEASPAGGGELVIRVFAADTMFIEVAGDFSEWNPVPLEREEGLWVARVRLAPGKYRVAVRSNLGPWRAPRNLARVRDDFGGEAGLIVIP